MANPPAGPGCSSSSHPINIHSKAPKEKCNHFQHLSAVSLEPIQARLVIHLAEAFPPCVRAPASFRCPAAIFVRLRTVCHTSARGRIAAFGGHGFPQLPILLRFLHLRMGSCDRWRWHSTLGASRSDAAEVARQHSGRAYPSYPDS